MSLPLPPLDDRTFDDLVAEGIRLIPGLAPSWTDHNPSDPGITLIELFAFVAEMLMYRADRISEASRIAFVRLLRGEPEWIPKKVLEEETGDAVLALRGEERAVTAADFERLALKIPGVERAYCLPGLNLESGSSRYAPAPGHISVVVIPMPTDEDYPIASKALRDTVKDNSYVITTDQEPYSYSRCLLTTQLHVVAAWQLDTQISAKLHVFADQTDQHVKSDAETRLRRYFDPVEGGSDGLGWPVGSNVYLSDLYALLDDIDGVDYVSELKLTTAVERDLSGAGARLEPDELIKPDVKIVVERAKLVRPEV